MWSWMIDIDTFGKGTQSYDAWNAVIKTIICQCIQYPMCTVYVHCVWFNYLKRFWWAMNQFQLKWLIQFPSNWQVVKVNFVKVNALLDVRLYLIEALYILTRIFFYCEFTFSPNESSVTQISKLVYLLHVIFVIRSPYWIWIERNRKRHIVNTERE